MVLQLAGNYPDQLSVGIEGALGDNAPRHIVTGVNETEAIPYGRMVQFDSTGTRDRSMKLSNAVARFQGITYHSHFAESFDPTLTGVAQVTTSTVAGVAADGQIYTYTLDGFTVSVTRVAGVPATNADIGAALRAAAAADPNINQRVIISGATVAVIATRRTAGSFSILTSATGTGTFVTALTTGGEADGIKANEEFNILRRGTIWLRPEDIVTPASGVFVRITAAAGVGTALGAFRGADDGANTEDLSAVAHWVTSSVGGEAGGLAKLDINLD